jgi:glucose/arabinose dehydrogenase
VQFIRMASVCACALLLCGRASAQPTPTEYRESSQHVHVVVPEQQKVDSSVVQKLRVPAGFAVEIVAQDLGNPRMIAVSNEGNVYITNPKKGEVMMLRDSDLGREGASPQTVVELEDVHGITIHNEKLYLATVHSVFVADLLQDGTAGAPRLVVTGLGDGGQHENRTLAFGPDGKLYVSVGSTCNACEEIEGKHAAMIQFNADGTGRHTFAIGLRNTIGFGWHPETRDFWGMDHGSDWRGNDVPPEELNRIVNGGNYGWPYCYGKQRVDEMIHTTPEGQTLEQYCAKTIPSVLEYQAHSAPMAMFFYNGTQFPAEYRGDAFVAMRGSWNRNPPAGYKLVRIRFDGGRPVEFQDFVTGFISEDGKSFLGRLVGVAGARDGSLLFTDDTNGVLYRVRHTGAGGAVSRR